jgi:hypothetical protein
MPTYLYKCEAKHGEFEKYHSVSQIMELCPKCQEEGLEPQKLQLLINCTTKGVVELTGQDLKDKVKADAQQLKKEMHNNEQLYANMLSPDKYEKAQKRIDESKKIFRRK